MGYHSNSINCREKFKVALNPSGRISLNNFFFKLYSDKPAGYRSIIINGGYRACFEL